MVIDVIIGSVIFISALVAFFRGLIREVLTILAVLGGSSAAYFYGSSLTPFYRNMLGVSVEDTSSTVHDKFLGVLPYPILADILGYVTIFLVVVIILSILSHYIGRGAEKIGLGLIDRTLGIIFGIARGLIVLAVIYLPFHMYMKDEDQKKEWFGDSRMLMYVEWTSEWILGFLPDDFMNMPDMAEKTDATRETLKALDLLPNVGTFQDGIESMHPQSTPVEGYDGSQRKSMEELIEEQERKDALENPETDNSVNQTGAPNGY